VTKNSNIALGVILGSGVDLDESIILDKRVILEDTTGVHKKIVYTCELGGEQVLIFKGRRHFYEGYNYDEITSNITYADKAGVKNLLITNAAGGLNSNFSEGDLMLITSHVNFNDRLKRAAGRIHYSKRLKLAFLNACRKNTVAIHEGTYGCYQGPTYETRAEVRFQKKIGLDAAGMSTIPEIYAARRKGMEVIAVSIITNLLKECSGEITSHENVLQTATLASLRLNKVLPSFVSELN
jgi:purine-nucleoside phosphorylase